MEITKATKGTKMPIAVYTKLEGDVGRCPTPQQGERACVPRRTENGEGKTERPCGATDEVSGQEAKP